VAPSGAETAGQAGTEGSRERRVARDLQHTVLRPRRRAAEDNVERGFGSGRIVAAHLYGGGTDRERAGIDERISPRRKKPQPARHHFNPSGVDKRKTEGCCAGTLHFSECAS